MSDDLSATENRLVHGVDQLGRATTEWLTGSDVDEHRARAAIGRAIGGTLAAGFAGGVLYELGPIAWGTSAALGALAVWAAGGDTDEPDVDEEFGPAVFLELVHDLAGGGNLHLSAVRAQLAEETGRPWSAPEVSALCRAADVPTRPGVRVPGATPAVTTGIHRDDLPPLPRPDRGSPVGDVSADQDDNNNTNTLTIEEVGQAARIIKRGPSIRQAAR